jgi:hypothetical protein
MKHEDLSLWWVNLTTRRVVRVTENSLYKNIKGSVLVMAASMLDALFTAELDIFYQEIPAMWKENKEF